jgi:hypothetical protein
MQGKKITEGKVEIRDKKYLFEFYSDNTNVYVVIHHPGKNGGMTKFTRNDKVGIKIDMENALKGSGFFK